MKALVLSAMTASALVLGPALPAHAAPVPAQYVKVVSDTCGMVVANDVAPTAPLGGPTKWNGVVYLAFVQVGGTVPHSISVFCELRVNGVSQGTVLGPASGTDAVALAGTISFAAAVTDIATLCAHVTVDSVAQPVTCTDATTTQVVPQPVLDAVDLVVCTALITVAPVVNFVFNPALVRITPTSGDLYVLGGLVYDCP